MDKAIYTVIALAGSLAMLAFATFPSQLNADKEPSTFTEADAAALAIAAQGLSFDLPPAQ